MAEAFFLSGGEIDYSGFCLSDLFDLSDRHAHNLKDYGEVDPRLADILDPDIDQLAQSALELGRIFEKKEEEK